MQPPYNLFERGIENHIWPYARWEGITTLVYGPICRGLLSGRMRPETQFSGDDLRKVDPKFQPPRYLQYLVAVERLGEFARDRFHATVMQLALRWVLNQPGVSVALMGARRPDQLGPLKGAMDFHLDLATIAQIDRILGEAIVDPVGPGFKAPPFEAQLAA
jgi:aryl-alcohol dehydrogenase-like predicted oxidoreductase